MTKKLLPIFTLGLAVTLPCLNADSLLTPGMIEVPATPTTLTGATMLASTGVEPVNFGTTVNPLTATVTETVYRDGINLACPAGGCLDFVYQFTDTTKGATNTFPGILERLTAASFSGFTTYFGYVANTGSNGTTTANIAPQFFSRSQNPGDVVSFSYELINVQPGQTSDLLVIATNAVNYSTNGTIGLQDGVAGSASGFSFSPTAGVPEPISMGLLGSGLALLGLVRYRQSAKKA